MKKGFTLIEVLGATLILTGFIAVISQVIYGGFKRVEKSRRVTKITFLLEQKMSEVESLYKNENIYKLPKVLKGEFENEEDYVWLIETQPLALPPALVLLSVQGLPQTDENLKVASFIKEVISSSVVELKLTVVYEGGAKPIKYSLVSYFVNTVDVSSYVSQLASKFIPSFDLLKNFPQGLGGPPQSQIPDQKKESLL